MRKRLLATAVAVVSSIAVAQDATEQEWIVEAHYPDAAALTRAASHFEHLILDRKRQVVRVFTDANGAEQLREAGLDSITIDQAASARLHAFEQARLQARNAGVSPNSIPGYACFRTVEETYGTMDTLKTAHPDIVDIDVLGPTWKKTQNAATGYDMRALRITNFATAASDPDRPKMVVFGSIHAREYAPAELVTRFGEWLVNNYGSDPEATWLVDHNDFRLVLEANPDGRKIAEQHLYQRKNVDTVNAPCSGSVTSSSQYGVDLNRNFPFHWNITNGQGSSGSFCNATYRGPVKASEPETQNLVNYVAGTCNTAGECSGGVFADRRTGPMNPTSVSGDGGAAAPADTSGFFIDIHSNAALVLWPWGDTQNAAPNQAALRTLGRRLAYFNGYTPEQSDSLYPTDGATDDTMYGLLGVPGFTIETDGADFFQDCASFESTTVPNNMAALRYAARTLHATYQLPSGPETLAVSAGSDLVAVGDPVSIAARIDDTRFNQSTASDGTIGTIRNIAGANATIDALPWESGAATVALSAVDGSFNASAENVAGTIDTSGLAAGRHVVYVQGVDIAGNQGPPNAAFIDLADAASVGTLQGHVTDRATSSPLAATITLAGNSETHHANSDATSGSYLAHGHPDTYAVHVSAPHHLSEDLSVALAAGGSVTHDFALYPNCTLFSDDVESGNAGWTAQTPWVIASNVSGNTTHVWNTPNYAANLNSSLTSAALDFTGYSELALDFDDRCATESGYDYGYVEYSINGSSTWQQLYSCNGQTTWQSHHVDLPSNANNANAFKLRFRLKSDGGVSGAGWAIDNIHIEGGGDACRAQQPNDDTIFVDGFDN